MRPRYVVDTNVLIAASAIDPNSPVAQDATPDDPALRSQVLAWLQEFETSSTRMVLDWENKIQDEYGNKLGFNDYGRQVVIHKISTSKVDFVDVLYDDDGHGCLDESLALVIHDRADRKMIAAALEAITCYHECAIANAADTDWYDWQPALEAAGIFVEQLLPEWSLAKWRSKQK